MNRKPMSPKETRISKLFDLPESDADMANIALVAETISRLPEKVANVRASMPSGVDENGTDYHP